MTMIPCTLPLARDEHPPWKLIDRQPKLFSVSAPVAIICSGRPRGEGEGEDIDLQREGVPGASDGGSG